MAHFSDCFNNLASERRFCHVLMGFIEHDELIEVSLFVFLGREYTQQSYKEPQCFIFLDPSLEDR